MKSRRWKLRKKDLSCESIMCLPRMTIKRQSNTFETLQWTLDPLWICLCSYDHVFSFLVSLRMAIFPTLLWIITKTTSMISSFQNVLLTPFPKIISLLEGLSGEPFLMEFLWVFISILFCKSWYLISKSRIKAILSVPIVRSDIQLIDPTLYHGMKRLEDSLAQDPSLEQSLELTFSVDITNSNIDEYNELMLKHAVYDNYRNSFYFILKGIFEVIPQFFFSVFTESELRTVLEGETGKRKPIHRL